MTAREQIHKWMARFDALTLRERGLVALAVVAVLVVLWQALLIGPLDAQRERTNAAIAKQRQQVQALDMQAQALIERQRQNPDRANRARHARLRAQMAELDAQLRAKMHGLIAPAQMAKVLEQVLTRKTDLKLYRVQSLAAQPLLTAAQRPGSASAAKADKTASAQAKGGAGDAGVYRHGLVIEFRGSYLSTLKYLHELDKLPWQFYWDSVELDVKHYPEATVTITVHTLSLDKDWIGV